MFENASWHPLVIHAPLALIPASVALSAVDLVRPRLGLWLAGLLLLVAGVGTAVIATGSGEAAEHRAERLNPALEDIKDSGPLVDTFGNGELLKAHAELGEMTRNVYGLLLLANAGIVVASAPGLARLRGRRWTLAGARLTAARWTWTGAAAAALVLVILTGHYGGKLVHDYGAGIRTTSMVPAAGQK